MFGASGSTDPYSAWLGEKIAEFYEITEGRPLTEGDGVRYGIAVTTEAERRSWFMLAHGDEFDVWLAVAKVRG